MQKKICQILLDKHEKLQSEEEIVFRFESRCNLRNVFQYRFPYVIVPGITILPNGEKLSDGSEGSGAKHTFRNILEIIDEYARSAREAGYNRKLELEWLSFSGYCSDWNPTGTFRSLSDEHSKEEAWEYVYNIVLFLDSTIFGKYFNPPNLTGGRWTNWVLNRDLLQKEANQQELQRILLGILTVRKKWECQVDISGEIEKVEKRNDARPAPEWIVENMMTLTKDKPEMIAPVYDSNGNLYWPRGKP